MEQDAYIATAKHLQQQQQQQHDDQHRLVNPLHSNTQIKARSNFEAAGACLSRGKSMMDLVERKLTGYKHVVVSLHLIGSLFAW